MCLLRIKPALDRAFDNNKKTFDLTPETKIVIFSDLHRGVGDWADDFMHNSLIFASALDYYYTPHFTYIELGDGDELYENRNLSDIARAHGNIFRQMDRFHKDNRLCYIAGNHNLQMRNKRWRKKELEDVQMLIPGLFSGIEIFETAMLGKKIFLFHGHQGDFINDTFIPFGRFWVRHIWGPLQNIFGLRDPTSPAQQVRKRNKVETGIIEWARERHMVAIAGHTHRPMFLSLSKQQRLAGEPEEPYYFNSGCGIHPRSVTCIEIKEMTIALIKWHITADSHNDMRLKVMREIIQGCQANLGDIIASL
jgi:predicted phosphodiesterase